MEQPALILRIHQGHLAALGNLERNPMTSVFGLSEPETVRHYTRLSRQVHAIDLGFFPLGSCTMTQSAAGRRSHAWLALPISIRCSLLKPIARRAWRHSRAGALVDTTGA
jgi:hypothetical protein